MMNALHDNLYLAKISSPLQLGTDNRQKQKKKKIERRMNCLFITAGVRKVRAFRTGRWLRLEKSSPPFPPNPLDTPFPPGGKGG